MTRTHEQTRHLLAEARVIVAHMRWKLAKGTDVGHSGLGLAILEYDIWGAIGAVEEAQRDERIRA